MDFYRDEKPIYNVGDKVTCIIEGNFWSKDTKLVLGEHYIVREIVHTHSAWWVSVINLQGMRIDRDPDDPVYPGWYAYRFVPFEKQSTTMVPTAAVNDYTCPTCQNSRCSKSEGTCWKCGSKL